MRTLKPHQKVFGLGLSRTGTTSLSEALRILGIRTVHYAKDDATRRELMAGNYDLSIFRRYQGFTDITVAPFYAELDRLLPGSKFILTVRDRPSWLRSIEAHLGAYRTGDDFGKFILEKAYGCADFDRERFARAYDSHVEGVTRHFHGRPDDLLVLDIVGGEGWDKLCPFLAMPRPGVPFPAANRTRQGPREKLLQDIEVLSERLTALIPESEAFILVNDKAFGHDVCPGRRAFPFLERDGRYWGRPADDDTAIRELTRLRDAGARYIVFTWVSFWWLEFYAAFHDHLRSRYRRVVDDDLIVVYRLDPPATDGM